MFFIKIHWKAMLRYKMKHVVRLLYMKKDKMICQRDTGEIFVEF